MMKQHLSIDFINRTTFERDDVVKHYQNIGTLHRAEKVILEKLFPTIKDSKILDIGVGAGRTTQYLSQISRDYTGIDYVQEFAQETARRFPEAKIICMDATDMSEFSNDSFDFVLFSYNSLLIPNRNLYLRPSHHLSQHPRVS